MDHIFTPWRYQYIKDAAASEAAGCVFCRLAASKDDREARIVYRGEHCFIVLNIFPYTTGHVMIVPYAHVDELRKLDEPAADEMMRLCRRTEDVLRKLYSPEGINLGMNIGKAAGAGVASHIHMHELPRWVADSNFMTTVGETRVLPESLDTTWERMKKAF
jgi:ATP adenylyltransferase